MARKIPWVLSILCFVRITEEGSTLNVSVEMTLEISMWLTYTEILGRREIHTTACPCICHHHSQKDIVRVMDVFYYSAQHWGWKSWLFVFLFPAEEPSQGAPLVVLQQQPAHQITTCIFPPFFCCSRGPAASIPFSPWAGKWLWLLHLPAPLGDWRMKLRSWDLNI